MNQNSPLSFSNIFKRETKLAAYFIICLTLVVLSVSYALFFSVNDDSNDQVVTAGDLKFTYQNGDTITSSGDNSKQDICFQPMTEEEAELYWHECSYKFSVQNTGTLSSTYSLSLSALEGNTIGTSKLKVILRQESTDTEHHRVDGYQPAKSLEELLNKENEASTTDEGSNTEYPLLTNIELGAKQTVVYEVQIYVEEGQYADEDSTKKIDFQINGKGIVKESEKLDPDKPFEGPFDNPTQQVDEDTGNGLYEVKHDDLTTDTEGGVLTEDLEGWKQTEWRYGGPNPDNYVTFNNEVAGWRIIGLVNVKTTSNTIEQRIKIIKAEKLQSNEKDFSWDYKANGKGSSTSNYGSNDWTDSQLMEMLNGIYYNSQSGNCYKGSSSPSTCNFTSNGLNSTAQGMIATDIIWNLGGTASFRSSSDGLVTHWYGYERGEKVYNGRPTEWLASNTAKASSETTSEKVLDSSLFRGVALPYPSDYGYATSGGSKGRAACLVKELYNWKNDYADCGNNDWLKPASGYMWTLSPLLSSSYSVFFVGSDGYADYGIAFNSRGVWPALYLSPSVSISGGTGTSSSPFQLTVG